ncbi:hypothetical protein ACF1D2_33095 [Streptomyces bacillaris]|uniref:hypothetical protein n=1 Tax=Streptomyces bacillaris TaxID=68179 RepID=UPI0036FA2B64
MTLVDLYAASVRTGTKPVTLRTWVHRGELTRHGYDDRRRVLVDLDEAIALAEAKATVVAA